MACALPETPAPADRKLGDIFKEAYRTFNALDTLDLAGNSAEFQAEVRKATALFEDATRLVSLIGLFSDNETSDEIATDHLKYMMLPYFLGKLVQKKTGGDRNEVVRVAEVYFKDFLARCEAYGFHAPGKEVVVAPVAASAGGKMAELAQMARQRNTKLEQYRLRRELEDEIKKVRTLMEREHIDETIKRDFFTKLIRCGCLEAADELRSIGQESEMLRMMGDPRQREQLHAVGTCRGHSHAPAAKLQPVIITKDAFQKAVYGAGYPSLPTMSVDDFYEQRVAEGIFPDPNVEYDSNSLHARAARGEATELDEEEEIQRELDEENDDEVYLARARNMDEFKDEVRRGDGNRHNRS